MSIDTIDPKARELDETFAQAMVRPARPRSQPSTPPELDPEAPFGRDDQGAPIAKYGYKNDGSIRLTGAGRPSKNSPEAARVADEPAPDNTPAPGSQTDSGDYTESLVEAADGLWLCVTAISKIPFGRLRIGQWGLPANTGQKIGAQAFVFSQHKYKLAAALNEAAKHNTRARRLAEKAATGDISWVLTVGALALPAMFQSAAVWKGDQSLAEMEMPPVAELARRNEAQMGEFVDSLAEAAAAIQAAADAQAAA